MPRTRIRLPSALKDCTREYSFFNPVDESPADSSASRSVTRTIQVPKTGSRKGTRAGGSGFSGTCRTRRSSINAGSGPGQDSLFSGRYPAVETGGSSESDAAGAVASGVPCAGSGRTRRAGREQLQSAASRRHAAVFMRRVSIEVGLYTDCRNPVPDGRLAVGSTPATDTRKGKHHATAPLRKGRGVILGLRGCPTGSRRSRKIVSRSRRAEVHTRGVQDHRPRTAVDLGVIDAG